MNVAKQGKYKRTKIRKEMIVLLSMPSCIIAFFILSQEVLLYIIEMELAVNSFAVIPVNNEAVSFQLKFIGLNIGQITLLIWAI